MGEMSLLSLSDICGFEWDMGNMEKIRNTHNVSLLEVEEVFFNELFIEPDLKHSLSEERIKAFGITNNFRLLFVIFTIRKNKLRPISARDMNIKERKYYNAKLEENT